ncbi:MAG: hypothetical protein IPP83_15145 [Flavobacteriales bacterium]|nr:hypothetical protein [Flavobacteriales bacterium]
MTAKLELRNAGEILGMGGPFMGDLFVDGALVDNEVMDEAMNTEDGEWCVYVKYSCEGRWRKDVRFRVCAYHVKSKQLVQHERAVEMLVLYGVQRTAIAVKVAFHKQYAGRLIRIPLPVLSPEGKIAKPWSQVGTTPTK